LENAYGSELVDLALPFMTEYFVDAATGFVPNTDDSCTTSVSVSLGAFTENLAAGETCVLDSGAPGDSGAGCAAAGPPALLYREPPLGGDFNLHLRAPGAGNDGSTTATADVPDWLEYDWDTVLPGFEDPTGTAVFGIFRGVDRRIYIRELY
jgi:MSHA biogenesis protein MshQ